MIFDILLYMKMNLHKLARMYIIYKLYFSTFITFYINFVYKAKSITNIFVILDFKKYFQLLHLLNIINTLMVPDIIICFLMHGNVNIVTTEKKVRIMIKTLAYIYIKIFEKYMIIISFLRYCCARKVMSVKNSLGSA